MKMWTGEFESGSLTDLNFSREFSLAVPPGVLLYASISLTGFTVPGKLAQQEQLTDFGDAYVRAAITAAGGQSLATDFAAGYPNFATLPTQWYGRLTGTAPTIQFGIQSHLAHARVAVQVIETDDPLDVIVATGVDPTNYPSPF